MSKDNKYINAFINSMTENTDKFIHIFTMDREYFSGYGFDWKLGYRCGTASIILIDDRKISRYSYVEIMNTDVMMFAGDYPALYDLFRALLDKIEIEYEK